MEINSKKLDELYKEWSGEHHTTNSNKPTHDSAECTDFAEYCLKYALSEGEMIPTRDSNCNVRLSFADLKDEILKYKAKSEYQQASIIILRNIFKAHEA
jgi:hypothetical protein